MAGMLPERYREQMEGVLSCYDPTVITKTPPCACFSGGMTSFLCARRIRIFNYPRIAEPLRDRIRAQALATKHRALILHINKTGVSKEEVVPSELKTLRDHPGQVHAIPTTEACNAHEALHDKTTH